MLSRSLHFGAMCLVLKYPKNAKLTSFRKNYYIYVFKYTIFIINIFT